MAGGSSKLQASNDGGGYGPRRQPAAEGQHLLACLQQVQLWARHRRCGLVDAYVGVHGWCLEQRSEHQSTELVGQSQRVAENHPRGCLACLGSCRQPHGCVEHREYVLFLHIHGVPADFLQQGPLHPAPRSGVHPQHAELQPGI